ncbi:alpha/beta fold hydrolase [Klebsiella pneumoniae]|uniref:alpha/beta fold hydrolase n=1 Tax=Klebsiella pneumoniae TaxID=573 RepID=UPI0020B165E9|nr:alpha/beta fold hydrolase [Klebsiella pneumoniae]
MTGFREQGSGIPLTLLHGISSGAASWHKQMALPGYRVLAWDMPGYGESPMLAAAPANAGDYADALARMLDRAGVEQTILVGHSLGALVAAAFAAKYPQRVLYLVLADVAQGYGQAEAAQREKVWQGRQQQIALGGEAMAQGRAAKLLRPGAREADVATVAAGMRRLRPLARRLSRSSLRVVWRAGCHYPTGVSAGSGAALRRPLHRHPSGWTCQLSR